MDSEARHPASEFKTVKSVWVPFSVQAVGSELGRSGHGRPQRPKIDRFRSKSQVSNSSS